MELHDVIDYNKNGYKNLEIVRVSDGWIYRYNHGNNILSVFVPYHNEFQQG